MDFAKPLMLDRPFKKNIGIEPLDIRTKFEQSHRLQYLVHMGGAMNAFAELPN